MVFEGCQEVDEGFEPAQQLPEESPQKVYSLWILSILRLSDPENSTNIVLASRPEASADWFSSRHTLFRHISLGTCL